MSKRNDPRFDDMHHAPLFKKVKKENFKTKLDDRFKSVLTDDRFSTGPSGVDKRGKKKSHNRKDATNDLKAFYDVDDSNAKGGDEKRSENKAETRLDYLSKLSRGEINMSGSDSDSDSDSQKSSESEDTSSSDSEVDSDNEAENSAPRGGAFTIPGDKVVTTADDGIRSDSGENEGHEDIEASNRLAIQNCDWDNMTAEDIITMSLESGSVKAVTVYPSDFGLERMEYENRYGPPKEIWNVSKTDAEPQSEDVDKDSESDSDSETCEIHVLDKNHPEEMSKRGIILNEKVKKQKEFDRAENSTGLVFDLNDAGEDDAPDAASSREKSSKRKPNSDMNSLALREYELSKLRYYFAIAELDNAKVAEKLYNELDGIEFEHSSMSLDLRIVPNDISFDGRKVRDRHVGPVSASYAPPEGFVVDALQKTNVECSWEDDAKVRPRRALLSDAHEDSDLDAAPSKGRKKKGSTASAWRRLQESDMSQYLASASDDDSSDGSEAGTKKKSSASSLRKLLLGGDAADDEDDFFLHPEDDDDVDDGSSVSSAEGSGDEGNMLVTDGAGDTDKVMTFVPEAEAESEGEDKKKLSRKQKKAEKKKSREAWDVPQETLRRMREEKRSKKKGNKSKSSDADNEAKSNTTDLELLFAGDDDDEAGDRLNYSKKEVAAAAELKEKAQGLAKKKKKLSKSKSQLLKETKDDNFEVDVEDSRFRKVIDGDANFGIDKLSNDYRATKGMEKILNERNKRKSSSDSAVEKPASDPNSSTSSKAALSVLANKLKSSFNKK